MDGDVYTTHTRHAAGHRGEAAGGCRNGGRAIAPCEMQPAAGPTAAMTLAHARASTHTAQSRAQTHACTRTRTCAHPGTPELLPLVQESFADAVAEGAALASADADVEWSTWQPRGNPNIKLQARAKSTNHMTSSASSTQRVASAAIVSARASICMRTAVRARVLVSECVRCRLRENSKGIPHCYIYCCARRVQENAVEAQSTRGVVENVLYSRHALPPC
jgi:hypothetical protein